MLTDFWFFKSNYFHSQQHFKILSRSVLLHTLKHTLDVLSQTCRWWLLLSCPNLCASLCPEGHSHVSRMDSFANSYIWKWWDFAWLLFGHRPLWPEHAVSPFEIHQPRVETREGTLCPGAKGLSCPPHRELESPHPQGPQVEGASKGRPCHLQSVTSRGGGGTLER